MEGGELFPATPAPGGVGGVGGMAPPGSGTPGLLHSGQAGGGARNYTDLYRKYTEVVSRRYTYHMCVLHVLHAHMAGDGVRNYTDLYRKYTAVAVSGQYVYRMGVCSTCISLVSEERCALCLHFSY